MTEARRRAARRASMRVRLRSASRAARPFGRADSAARDRVGSDPRTLFDQPFRPARNVRLGCRAPHLDARAGLLRRQPRGRAPRSRGRHSVGPRAGRQPCRTGWQSLREASPGGNEIRSCSRLSSEADPNAPGSVCAGPGGARWSSAHCARHDEGGGGAGRNEPASRTARASPRSCGRAPIHARSLGRVYRHRRSVGERAPSAGLRDRCAPGPRPGSPPGVQGA